jgi:uncharacterized 2Fe-2S/4Fe-4S cluster protein (DUF4445 family)
MPLVKVRCDGSVHNLERMAGESLFAALERHALLPRADCGGGGTCGLCRVHLEAGAAEPVTAVERGRLTEAAIANGERLACRLKLDGDATISIVHGRPQPHWRTLHGLPPAELGGERAEGLGLAVDLGSSNIRLSLCDLAAGRRLAARTGLNPQLRFGADILSRLARANGSAAEAARIAAAAREAIADGLSRLRGHRQLPVGRVSVVGNTAMLALLSGRGVAELLDPDHWSQPVDCAPAAGGRLIEALGAPVGARLDLVAPLAGFVGSDLLAGLLASRLTEGPPGSLLIDFGTNTECALWDGAALWVTAAAGGPAFEGTGLSCGMPAVTGAVDRVGLRSDGGLALGVIGKGPACGVCGSGLVDALAVLRATDRLAPSGRFRPGADGAIVAEADLRLLPADIDLFQRAKAAVAAAAIVLLGHAGMAGRDLGRVVVTGAFGERLSIANSQSIGLLPSVPIERIAVLPDIALRGAERLVGADDPASLLAPIRCVARFINLASEPSYEDLFIGQLRLAPFA